MNPMHTSDNDTTDKFMRDISRLPLLCAEQEQELATRIAGGDQEAYSQLVEANYRLVVSIAKRYTGHGLDLDDLVQAGALGMMRAAQLFKPNMGKFSTYATWWIRQAIGRELEESGCVIRIPSHVHESLRVVRRISGAIETETGRPPTIEELSAHTGKSKKQLAMILSAQFIVVSMDEPSSDSFDEAASFTDLLEDPNAIDPYQVIDSTSDIWLVQKALTRLPEREADILRRRFGMDDYKPQTLSELSEVFGVSRERVRQLETKAMIALKAQIMRMEHKKRSKVA